MHMQIVARIFGQICLYAPWDSNPKNNHRDDRTLNSFLNFLISFFLLSTIRIAEFHSQQQMKQGGAIRRNMVFTKHTREIVETLVQF